MEDNVDNCAAEVVVLRRKLQSKAEALLILTKELEQCRTERDQFKLIAEQAQNRPLLKKSSDEQALRGRLTGLTDNYAKPSVNGSNFDHYLEVREQNKSLRFEIQDLKQKLREAYGDIKVLRAGAAEGSRFSSVKEVTPAHQREELVEQLERMGAQVSQLEGDLRGVLDDKEELVSERELYRAKVARLNHQLNTLLGRNSARLIDLDGLLMDNKYLQEQLQQLQAEKELAQQALVKYKSMLEKKKNKGIVKLGIQNSAMVVSHKQVQELLVRGTAAELPDTEATLADLKSLCLALLEALQDKCLALSHQRKANKILASRISELEHRLGPSVPVFPSELLMQDCSSVDREILGAGDALTRAVNGSNTFTDLSQGKDEVPPTCSSNIGALECAVNGCDTDLNESLPQDIQDLVTKALQEIHNEESKPN